ncbi:MAG: hypothetical protein NW201_09040 [Gemmatimonadales bacterium]|nr:hypothetical protein [Gemmatimonadales bacterium]
MSQSSSRVAQQQRGVRTKVRAAEAAPEERVRALLAQLTKLRIGRHRVVSCYLKLEPRDRARGKYAIKLKNRIRETAEGLGRLGLERHVHAEVERDLARILEHLRQPANLPATQGVAVFACEALDLFEVTPLPVVYKSRIAVEETALVRELAAVEASFGRLLTVVLDRVQARLFEVTAYGCRELEGIAAAATRGGRFRGDQDAPGWGEHAYHNRIREEGKRHFEAIARLLFDHERRHPVHGIVLAGPGPEAPQVEPFLHEYQAGKLLGFAKLAPKAATPALVHAMALEVRDVADRGVEGALARELEEAWGAGWAKNGVSVTLKALARGQVRTLLVDPDARLQGFRASETGRLVEHARETRGEGEAQPVLDLIDDAIEEALRQRVEVRVLQDDAARDAVDGLAGLLRFR